MDLWIVLIRQSVLASEWTVEAFKDEGKARSAFQGIKNEGGTVALAKVIEQG